MIGGISQISHATPKAPSDGGLGVCPGRDSNPHEGNPHRILSPAGGISKYLSNKQKSRRPGTAILAGVSWSELELDCRGHISGTTPWKLPGTVLSSYRLSFDFSSKQFSQADNGYISAFIGPLYAGASPAFTAHYLAAEFSDRTGSPPPDAKDTGLLPQPALSRGTEVVRQELLTATVR